MATLLRVLIISTLLSGLSGGCAKDPFSLREPEPPGGEEGTYDTPVDPLIVARNLRFAMTERNIANYERTYADNFEYTFDFLLVDRPGLGNTWTNAEESRIVRNLFDDVDSIALTWTETAGQPDQFDDSTAVLYRTYKVTTVMTDADSLISAVFEGDLVFHMERNALDLWWIVRWEDRHLGDDQPAWSDLKSQYL